MRGAAATALVLLASACSRPAERPLAARLADRAGASSAVEADTRALAALGARVTGSAACARGEELAASRLREAGLAPVLETYARPEGAALDAPARNVLADIRGTDGSRGLVLLAAHLDGVAVGQGAADDAVNVAVLLEAARTLKALAPPPRRTIRFAFFTGEEQKMKGSAAYLAAHEGDAHALAVVFDLGSGKAIGFYMNGRKQELRALFQRFLAPDRRWYALFGTYSIWEGCDALPFVQAGIPVLTLLQEDADYLVVHHTPADVVEALDFASARRNAALASAIAWGAANDAEPDLRHMTADESRALLERHHITP